METRESHLSVRGLSVKHFMRYAQPWCRHEETCGFTDVLRNNLRRVGFTDVFTKCFINIKYT